MPRTLLVDSAEGEFRIIIPDGATVTFGPFSPPTKQGYHSGEGKIGTLRVYQGGKENVIFVRSGVYGFRDLDAIEYSEKVTTEEVSTVWKSDRTGYSRETTGQRTEEWHTPNEKPALQRPPPRRRR